MDDFNRERSALREAIEDAFTNVDFPEDDNILSQDCIDDTDIADFRHDSPWKRNWREIPAKIVDRNYQSLAFFSPEAHRFYLAAYLVRALDTFSAKDTNVLEFTLYDLVPNRRSSWNIKRFELRKQALRSRQKGIVIQFLEFVRKWCNDDTLSCVADEGLRVYWCVGPTELKQIP